MTEDKKNVKKKTLGISSGKLGLSGKAAGANFLQKAGKASGYGKSSASPVVVVSRNRTSNRTTSYGSGHLSQEEILKRVQILKNAEKAKKQSIPKAPPELPNNEKADVKDLGKKIDEKELKDSEVIKKESNSQAQENKDIVAPNETKKPLNLKSIDKKNDSKGNSKSYSKEDFKKEKLSAELKDEYQKTELVKSGQKEVKDLDKVYSTKKTPVSKVVSAPTNIIKNTVNITHSKKKKAKSGSEEGSKTEAFIKKQPSELKRGNKNKLSVLDSGEESGYRARSLSAIKRAQEKKQRKQTKTEAPKLQKKIIREVAIPDLISVQELSNRMAEKASDLIKALMNLGMMITVNQSVDADTAELLVTEFGHKPKRVTDEELERSYIEDSEDEDESLKQTRPPVVTIMGHVDHGKTSLLDALHSTDIAEKESGGITQHIGAYMVRLSDGKSITFLDTPGHEAFTAMRMRGAKVTDIVVLVVAADDSIKEQTIEAINHSKAAGVTIIVAINKIDKPGADPISVKNALLVHSLVPEDMGGDIMVVEISAKEKIGLDKLEEAILLQADLLSLKANYDGVAKGTVVESRIDKGRGIIATLLIQKGTLKVGDIIVAGSCYGKVRSLVDDKRNKIKNASPSMPVEVLGLNQVPMAGDGFAVVEDERSAKELADFRAHREKEKKMVVSRNISMDKLFIKAKQDKSRAELPVIIKADVHGSAEAINASLLKLPNEEVDLRILHSGVGGITESDITLAATSGALVVGFNVRANHQARDLAKNLDVKIEYHSIIYTLVDEVKAILSGMLSPNIKEKFLGYADVRKVFDLSKFGKVAGCYVTEGMVQQNSQVRLLRDSVVIHEGKLRALKRFKEDVKEAKMGFECGISLEKYEDIKIGDKIEAFEIIEETRTL